jgi:hypothetical protein
MPTRFRPCRLRLAATLLAALTVPAGNAGASEAGTETARSRHICASAVAAAERAHGIPHRLLTAISHAESGRWDTATQATIAWPWTVTAEGTGHYLPSRAAAIAKVEALRARGIRNIDVGCMQINLRYHPDAFETLDTAFDPANNAAYAGRFLAALERETGSWPAAAARYHSATRKFAAPYGARIMRLWRIARADAPAPAATREHDDDAERKRAADAHRRAVVAAYLARRAEQRAAHAADQVAAAAN